MPTFRRDMAAHFRPHLKPPGFGNPALIRGMDEIFDRAGVPKDDEAAPAGAALGATGEKVAPAPAAAGPLSWDEFERRLTNRNAPALVAADFDRAAAALGVTAKHVRASKTVEAPRGPFDDKGRPNILFERHVFARNTSPKNAFSRSHPHISGGPYGPGGYGPFSAQYGKLREAYGLDPEAACEGCSWGSFQVLGENATALGYPSAVEMALTLAESEAAHLDSYIRFIRWKGLDDELRRCRAGDPESCIPFVAAYNGSAFRRYAYHVKFAEALR